MPRVWADEPDPAARRAQALADLYRYYSANRRMLAMVAHEAPTVPALAGPLRARAAPLAAVAAELGRGLGLGEAHKAALALAWLEGAAAADAREGTAIPR